MNIIKPCINISRDDCRKRSPINGDINLNIMSDIAVADKRLAT